MGNKRKPESPLDSEPSVKLRRISTTSHPEEAQDGYPVATELPTQRLQSEEPTFYRAPLTKKNLRQLRRMTKPKPSNTGSAASGSGSAPTTTSNSKSKSSEKSLATTDSGFDQQFRKNGAHGPSSIEVDLYPPVNLDEIEKYLDKSRASASPTFSQHQRFKRAINRAANERDVEALYTRRVLKDTNNTTEFEDIEYGANIDKQWVDFDKEVGFNHKLSAPKPDLVEGYVQSTFPPSIKQLGGAATLVKDNPDFVALPHFAVEFKGVGKDFQKARTQAGYDGSSMVYARDKALEHIGQPDPERHASPLSMAIDGYNWEIFANYKRENEEKKRVEYFQYSVKNGITATPKTFRDTYRISRNAQDWARKESTDLRDRLQTHYDLHGDVPAKSVKPRSAGKSQASDTSTKSSVANLADTKSAPAQSSRSDDATKKLPDEPKKRSEKKSNPPVSPSVKSTEKSSARSSGKDTNSRPASSVSGDRASEGSGLSTPSSAKKSNARSLPDDAKPTLGKPSDKEKADVKSKSMPPPIDRPTSSRTKQEEGVPLTDGKQDTRSRSSNGMSRSNRTDTSRVSTPSRASTPSTSSKGSLHTLTSNREEDDRRRYRNREDGIQPLQHRRSDSPDRFREPRPQDQNRDNRSNGRGREEDRSERSSASFLRSLTGVAGLPKKPDWGSQSTESRDEYVDRVERVTNGRAPTPTSDVSFGRRW